MFDWPVCGTFTNIKYGFEKFFELDDANLGEKIITNSRINEDVNKAGLGCSVPIKVVNEGNFTGLQMETLN